MTSATRRSRSSLGSLLYGLTGSGAASSSSASRLASSSRSAWLIRRNSALSITASLSPFPLRASCAVRALQIGPGWARTWPGCGPAARKLGKVSELVYLGFGACPVEYREGWDLQRRVHARRVADEVPDSCLLLEHEPVYTAGKRTAVSDRPFGDPGAPVIDVDRGGKITWHGSGQLTGYPIIKLREPLDV